VPFRALLEKLVAATRGARGAIFCDLEGESIDLFVARPQPAGCGELTEFDLKICGAQVAAPLLGVGEVAAEASAGAPREVRVLCAQGTLLCRVISDGYYVVLLLAPGGRSGDATRKLRETSRLVQAAL
jgi:hypothetical protein